MERVPDATKLTRFSDPSGTMRTRFASPATRATGSQIRRRKASASVRYARSTAGASIPFERARSQMALTGVICPVMLTMCAIRISRVLLVITFANASTISSRFFGGIGILIVFRTSPSRCSR